MSPRCPDPRGTRREAGYGLLMVVFLAAVMLITAVMAAPSLLTQGRRDKEEELIWRGGQYTRAVRMYYRKYGRFPQSVDDLVKAKGDIRFLRKAYTDPMNKADGSWRLIYVTASGQLIGSIKRQSLLQFPVAGQPAAPQPGTPAAGMQQGIATPQAPTTPQTGLPGQPPAQPDSATALEGKVFGGNIIGVGSKVNRPSLRVYDGGANYREWEFIWDPAKDALAAGQPAAPAGQPGTPTGQPPGTTPPPQNPPTPPQ